MTPTVYTVVGYCCLDWLIKEQSRFSCGHPAVSDTLRRGTLGFAVLRCRWFFLVPVLRWIKSHVAVLRWSQIVRCAVFLILNLQCSVKQNYLRTLCGVVVYCNAVLTVPQRPPPYAQELNPPVYKKTRKKCVEITLTTSDSYNPLFWQMN